MASAGFFDDLTDKDLLSLLRNSVDEQCDRNQEQQCLALDFLNNKQKTRTTNAIVERYSSRQGQKKGARIDTIILPVSDRFIAESSTAYNKQVKRVLVDEDGETKEEETKILNEELEKASYDEKLHCMERICTMPGLEACGVWTQIKNNGLSFQVIPPNKIYTVSSFDVFNYDKNEQDDFFGYVVELSEKANKDGERQYLFIGRKYHAYFKSSSWSEPKNIQWFINPIEWTQDYEEQEKQLPLQMMTIWRSNISTNGLLFSGDASIADVNLNINIQFSIMLDTIRKSGWKQLALKLLNPNNPPAQIQLGTGTAIPLGPDEDITAIDLGTNFDSIVNSLKSFLKIVAVFHRQSPNDFSIDAQIPASGFAKLVDSLPKIEAREERIKRYKNIEERYMWPRIGGALEFLGKIKNASSLKMRVEYPKVEFPLSADERIRLEEYEIKNGMSSAADILVKQRGISKEEAENIIEENKPEKEEMPKQEEQTKQTSKTKLFAEKLIAQKSSGIKEEKEKEE